MYQQHAKQLTPREGLQHDWLNFVFFVFLSFLILLKINSELTFFEIVAVL